MILKKEGILHCDDYMLLFVHTIIHLSVVVVQPILQDYLVFSFSPLFFTSQ